MYKENNFCKSKQNNGNKDKLLGIGKIKLNCSKIKKKKYAIAFCNHFKSSSR